MKQRILILFIFFYSKLDRANSSILNNNILPDAYPLRSNSAAFNPDLSRAFRVDAHLLAIIRTEDKRSKYEELLFLLFSNYINTKRQVKLYIYL
jgi:hypothetical protein